MNPTQRARLRDLLLLVLGTVSTLMALLMSILLAVAPNIYINWLQLTPATVYATLAAFVVISLLCGFSYVRSRPPCL